MADETLLVLSGIGIPPYSARGLTQTLTPIQQQGALRRTLNGAVIDLGLEQFKKYASVISCNDADAPAFDGLWRGDTVVVDCVKELCFAEGSGSPSRTVVPGSYRTADGFVFYRPRLTMVVTDFSQSKDEYGAVTSWQLSLEEA